MKGNDFVIAITLGVVSAVVSVFVVNFILGNPDEASVKVTTIDPIDSFLATPDYEIFNINAINPTVDACVGTCDVEQ